MCMRRFSLGLRGSFMGWRTIQLQRESTPSTGKVGATQVRCNYLSVHKR